MLALLPEQPQITGVTYTRVTGPLWKLKERGHHIDWMTWGVARESAKQRKGQVTRYDMYLLQRAGDTDGRTISLVETLRAAGKKVVWETDDDYTNEYRQVLEADAVTVANLCNAVTVSTPSLREQMIKHMTEPMPYVYLLQNCIDLDFWDHMKWQRVVPNHLTVGMVGTRTHGEDWKLASPALHRLAGEFPEVHFVIGGFLPDYLDDLPRMTYLPSVEYQYYPAMCKQIDIGLAPLVPDDPFNWSKSGIKAMEYWASGAAVVASKAKPYERVYNEDRMLMASNDEEWYQAIKRLITSEEERRLMAQCGREFVRTKRNMDHNCDFWWDVYMHVYEGG